MFPLISGGEHSRRGWCKMLEQWRESGKLLQTTHWHYRLVHGSMCKVYDPIRVIALINTEANCKQGCVRPRIDYLYTTYYSQLCDLLQSVTHRRTDDKQDIPT